MNGDVRIKASLLSIFLWLVSLVYGLIIRFRIALYSWGILTKRNLPCFVISIGNITVGGTGKTPMTIYIAKMLEHQGYNVAIISRGYKGDAEDKGGIISDGKTLLMDVHAAGDEPLMMAVRLKNIPVLAGKRRFDMGMIAKRKFNCDIIVLDDGFQHLKLKRDIDIVLLESRYPLGNSFMLPRGTLREPVHGLNRADAFIMTRSDQTEKPIDPSIEDYLTERPVYKSYHTPYYFKVDKGSVLPLKEITTYHVSNDFTEFENHTVLAFSGIAKNHYFKNTIERMGFFISDFMDYPDHYPYSKKDLDHIVLKANQLNIDSVITTEKDYMRIYRHLPLPINLFVVGVKITFEDETAFRAFIKEKLESIRN